MNLRDFYLKRAKAEFPVFLKVLRALPEDLSYKPHERSAVGNAIFNATGIRLRALPLAPKGLSLVTA